jgi:hypothetical protein
MLNLTWDTNCLITIESEAPRRAADKVALQHLLGLHDQGQVRIRLSAGTAAELQPDRTYLQNLQRFQERRTVAGLGHLELLHAPARLDMSFLDHIVLVGDDFDAQIRSMFAVMFPGESYDPPADFDETSPATQAWRNKIIDVEMYWSHVKNDGHLFVTRNSRDFIDDGRRERLLELFGGRGIEVPTDAVGWVSQNLDSE